ncbi:MAG TPA: glycosyltransferase [Candidatus Acidoferrum sp.]|jgi:hypothetical protein
MPLDDRGDTRVIGTSAKQQTIHSGLRGARICHLSAIQNRRDARALNREAAPCAEQGLQVSIVGPHGERGFASGVQLISTPPSANRVLRILTAYRAAISAAGLNADVYHAHSPEMIPAGLLLKIVYGKRVIYDTREDYPSMMLTKTYLRKPFRKLARHAISLIERLAANICDGFVTADSGTLRNYARSGSSAKLVFYNMPNLRFFPAPSRQEKEFDLVYRGGLSKRAGTFDLLQAVRLLNERGFPARLLMFGYTDDRGTKDTIVRLLKGYGIQHLVEMRGVIPHEEMATTLQSARIAVCPLQAIPKFLNNIPVKVFESWACGLAVVASNLPPIRPFFPRGQQQFLTRPGDAEDLARALEILLRDPIRTSIVGNEGRKAVEERYNSNGETKKLLSLYANILRKDAMPYTRFSPATQG